MPLFPFLFNQTPGCDPVFAEVNITRDGYYEVGGISEYGTEKYYSKPHFTGSLKEIAREMFLLWVEQDPIFQNHALYVWPLKVIFKPKTAVSFLETAIPISRDQKTDLKKFLADITTEFDRLKILLPFL